MTTLDYPQASSPGREVTTPPVKRSAGAKGIFSAGLGVRSTITNNPDFSSEYCSSNSKEGYRPTRIGVPTTSVLSVYLALFLAQTTFG